MMRQIATLDRDLEAEMETASRPPSPSPPCRISASHYEVICVCGALICTIERTTVCHACGRHAQIDWGWPSGGR